MSRALIEGGLFPGYDSEIYSQIQYGHAYPLGPDSERDSVVARMPYELLLDDVKKRTGLYDVPSMVDIRAADAFTIVRPGEYKLAQHERGEATFSPDAVASVNIGSRRALAIIGGGLAVRAEASGGAEEDRFGVHPDDATLRRIAGQWLAGLGIVMNYNPGFSDRRRMPVRF